MLSDGLLCFVQGLEPRTAEKEVWQSVSSCTGFAFIYDAMIRVLPMTLIRAGGLPLGVWHPFSGGMPDWSALLEAERSAAEGLRFAFDEALAILPESQLRTHVYNTRKHFFQRQKPPSARVLDLIHTTQALSKLYAAHQAWHQTQEAKQAAEILFAQQVTQNFQQLQSLTQSYREPFLRSLLFASHDLLDRIPGFEQKPAEQFDKKDRQTAFSLLQYLTRAVFKPSPLGRFSTLELREWPELEPQLFSMQKALVTPNVAMLPALYEVLLREPAFYQSLSLVLNPCLVRRLENQGRFWLYYDGEREVFQEIAPDPVADFVLDILIAERGEMPYPKLVATLIEQVDATEIELQNLVFQLVDMGMLAWKFPEQGLTPGWCGGLYQYLGFLPSSPVLTDAAYLLQWLRTAARVLPFQSIEEAQTMQRDALGELRAFFEKYGTEPPPIPPEQVFFEDVAQASGLTIPVQEMEGLLGQLAECWLQKALHMQDSFRARLFDFAQQHIPDGERMDFLAFSRQFLAAPANAGVLPKRRPYTGKLGALLQIFRENGKCRAVVNAMYPGGGKMFARWLPLFPVAATTQIRDWAEAGSIQFPWQGWSNANFQPLLSDVALAVPDARVGCLGDGRTIRLGDLQVGKNEEAWPQLYDKQTGRAIHFNDLGLEAPDSRPPVIRLLWYLGVPFVSVDSMLPETMEWEVLEAGVQHRRRVEYKALVLTRALWVLSPTASMGLFPKEKTRGERIGFGGSQLLGWGVPRQFFGRIAEGSEKPQFYDMDSPISMLLLEKNTRGANTPFIITEMLPSPAQWLGDRVGEFVLEVDV